MVMKQPKMVLLDLDGTLVDSVPDLAFSVDEMMTFLGRPVYGEEKVRHWVGNGVDRLVRRALTNTMSDDPDDALIEQALPVFMESYGANNSNRSRVYPGIVEGLDWLKDQGIKLGCVTNKAECFTLPLLKNVGLFDYFKIVVSGDTLANKKPHPEPLLHAATFFSVASEDCLMVGDSQHDVKAARAAGFAAVCVPYGYNHGEDIRLAESDAVIESLDKISELF
jgi:phosphoglycolate phosphatase